MRAGNGYINKYAFRYLFPRFEFIEIFIWIINSNENLGWSGWQTDELAATDIARWLLLTSVCRCRGNATVGDIRAFGALYIIYIQYHPSKSPALDDGVVDVCGYMQPVQTAHARSFHCANVNDCRSFPMKTKLMQGSLTHALVIYQIDDLIRSIPGAYSIHIQVTTTGSPFFTHYTH